MVFVERLLDKPSRIYPAGCLNSIDEVILCTTQTVIRIEGILYVTLIFGVNILLEMISGVSR